MRIVTVSDLHIGKQSWGDTGEITARKAADIDCDVLYFCGDLADPDKSDPKKSQDDFKKGLEILSKSFAKNKLFVLGNNDLELLLNSKLTNHYEEMCERVSEYGFHLLDNSPKIIDSIGFVGNVGWYDGSLWHKWDKDTKWPNTIKDIKKASTDWFVNKEFKGLVPDGLTPIKFYEHCKERLNSHLQSISSNKSVDAIVLGTHFVPNVKFVNDDNPEFNFLNWYMGSSEISELYKNEKILVGFTGHTHRSDSYEVNGTMVHNLSGVNQPRVFEIERDEKLGYNINVELLKGEK